MIAFPPTERIENYLNANWKPLEEAMSLCGLPKATCGGWMWMTHGANGSESYKHVNTRRYIWVGSDGLVYHPTGLQIDDPAKARRVLETGDVTL